MAPARAASSQPGLCKRIIPCLDVDAGRVVKGTNFVNLKDAGDPVERAKFYDVEGADEIPFLDITATHEKRKTIAELAAKAVREVFVPITIGGGIRTVEDAQTVLDAGADNISVNSAVVARPELLDEEPIAELRLKIEGFSARTLQLRARWHKTTWQHLLRLFQGSAQAADSQQQFVSVPVMISVSISAAFSRS